MVALPVDKIICSKSFYVRLAVCTCKVDVHVKEGYDPFVFVNSDFQTIRSLHNADLLICFVNLPWSGFAYSIRPSSRQQQPTICILPT